jgi:peptide/nickel transport system substrate-binding protein
MLRVGRRRIAAVAVTGAGALVLAGGLVSCARGDGGPTGPAKDVVITVATVDKVTSLDPAAVHDTGSRTLLANMYQTLLTIIPGKPIPVPDAADCQFDTPTTYTCTLKSNQTFHNGHELLASDVKFSFERLLRIRAPEGPAGLFGSLKSIETPDETTVVFQLKRADATFPYLLTTTGASIVDEEVYPPKAVLPDARAVGSGPYRLTEYKPGARAVLERYAPYKGARPPENGKVVVNYLKNSNALATAVATRRADVGFRGIAPLELKKLRAAKSVQVVEGDAAEIGMFAFNHRNPVMRKVGVRRAVAQLVDREQIVAKAYDGRVVPLYSLMPTGFGGHTGAFKSEYDRPDRLKAAGMLQVSKLTPPVPLTVGYTPSFFGPGSAAAANELKRQLDASGLFTVRLVSAEWPQYLRNARAGQYDLFQFGWVPDFPDGDNFLSPFLREGGTYANGYRSNLADKMLDLEIGSQNQVDRDQTFRDIQTHVANDVPVIPIWQGRMTVVAGQDVQNVKDTLNPLFYFYFSYLTK